MRRKSQIDPNRRKSVKMRKLPIFALVAFKEILLLSVGYLKLSHEVALSYRP
jgi:hypothetical protein